MTGYVGLLFLLPDVKAAPKERIECWPVVLCELQVSSLSHDVVVLTDIVLVVWSLNNQPLGDALQHTTLEPCHWAIHQLLYAPTSSLCVSPGFSVALK